MSVTIKDIAAEAQVSYQAVSAVLNDKTNCRVSATTRARILEIAQRRGYRTNFGYQLIMRKPTRTAALVLSMPQIEREEYIKELLLRLMEGFNAMGITTYFNNLMTTDPGHNLAQINELIARGVEHFIFFGSPAGHEAIAATIRDRTLTYVGFKSRFDRNLGSDSVSASIEVLRYFRDHGAADFRLIIPMALDNGQFDGGYRFMALQRFFPEQSAEALYRRYVVRIPAPTWQGQDFGQEMFRLGYDGTAIALRQSPAPLALFYLADHYALGGAAYLYEHGYQVGKDILLAGFNNIDAVRFHPLPIT